MPLFSKSQYDKILQAAAKSKQPLEEVKASNVSTKSITSKIQSISNLVIDYFKDSDAVLIQDPEQLHEYVTDCINSGIVAFDTETTGLDRIHDYCVGSSLYHPNGKQVYIPNKHRVPIFEQLYKNQISYEVCHEEFMRLKNKKVKFVMANADFDLSVAYKDYSVDLIDNFYYDVILAWRCLKENEKKNDLKSLYAKYPLKGNGDPKRFSDFFPVDLFPYCKPEVAKLYAANDAEITYKLYQWQLPYVTPSHPKCKKNHLERIASLIWNIEFPLVAVCQSMFRTGVYIDDDVSSVLDQRYSDEQKIETKKLQDMVQAVIDSTPYSGKKRPFLTGSEFNHNSPIHTQFLLYDLMQLPSEDKKSTGKEVLEKMNNPIANQILKVRSIDVLINTFVKKLPKSVAPDHRIHAQFKQIGADCITGDTWIPTKSGYRTMYELCEPISFYPDGTHIDYAENNPIFIINKHKQYEKAKSCVKYTNYQVLNIETDYGFKICGTLNHPIIVSDSNSMIINPNFVNLENVKIGDLVQFPYNYAVDAEQTDVDEDFAEFLGIIHACGAFNEKQNVIYLCHDNYMVRRRFSELSNVMFGLVAKEGRKNELRLDVRSILSNNSMHLFKLCGIDHIIPGSIKHSSNIVIDAYIRGLSCGSKLLKSGSLNTDSYIKLVLQGLHCIDDMNFVHVYLLSYGIVSDAITSCIMDTCEYSLYISDDDYSQFCDKIGVIEPSKYFYSSKRISASKYIKDDNYIYLPIRKITTSVDTVYDLHVPNTHSFVSNGMISHNTGRFSSAEPNLQNIPSHASDIRHMFRATPSMLKDVHESISNDEYVEFNLCKFDKVTLQDNSLKKVEDLSIGDMVIVDHKGSNELLKYVDRSMTDNVIIYCCRFSKV